ncbi:MAG: hypothetical protein HKN42_04880, partial [Granulosicoccus sp.]|nr:hypothetical protein [Granulosicoccus sp.]
MAYLVMSSRQQHSRIHLASLFWPDRSEKDGRNNLRVALTRIGKHLSSEGKAYFCNQGQLVSINPEADVWTDAIRFTECIEFASKHKHVDLIDCIECCKALDTAANLYQGSFMDGFYLEGCEEFEEWQLSTREILHQQAVQLLTELGNLNFLRHDYRTAELHVRKCLHMEPLREDSHRMLMQ